MFHSFKIVDLLQIILIEISISKIENVLFFIVAVDADAPCTSSNDNTKVCLTKQELTDRGFGVLKTFMKGGDPCFLGQKNKRVIVDIFVKCVL